MFDDGLFVVVVVVVVSDGSCCEEESAAVRRSGWGRGRLVLRRRSGEGCVHPCLPVVVLPRRFRLLRSVVSCDGRTTKEVPSRKTSARTDPKNSATTEPAVGGKAESSLMSDDENQENRQKCRRRILELPVCWASGTVACGGLAL